MSRPVAAPFAASAASTFPRSVRDTAFIGHPRGLAFLTFTEAWERFSYYGMQALLVLYMASQLLHPGHIEHVAGFAGFRRALEGAYGPLSITALASAIFGLYAGTVYLTPILGGLLADRLLGRQRTILLGGSLMAAGHFMMAFEVSFLIALLCLALGAGCMKGNIAAQVGRLYMPGDLRRADAFQIFFIGINAGVIAAPLICGTLGEKVGWDWGFGSAGVGMLISLAIYLAGRRDLPADPPLLSRAGGARTVRPALQPGEGATVAVLIGLLPVLAIGAVVNMQIFNAYLLWGQATYDFRLFGRALPTTWLVTLDAVVSVSFLFISVGFWRLWAKRYTEPDEITKILIGTVLSVGAALVLYAASAEFAATGVRVSLWWAIAFHAVNSAGFSNVFPVGLALYARAAPPALTSTIVGIYYLHLFAANNIVGWIGGLLDKMPATRFWALHAALVAAAAVLFFVVRLVFRRRLAPGVPAGRPDIEPT